jgi:phosphoglycerate kinase
MEHSIPSIKDVENLAGTYVFVRASLNVPIKDGKVANAFRLQQSLKTIQFLVEKRARVILCSHLGRDGESLFPVYEALSASLDIQFCPEVVGETATAMRNSLENGGVLLLENVRRDAREEENDIHFAEELAALADIFVNDDFAASHRAHASLHAICTLLPSYAGLGFLLEYEELSKVMSPESPSLFILGGAKFETKMPLVEKYLKIYDHIFIGGALANDFFKAKGFEVGTSLVSDISLEGSPLLSEPKILIPIDVTAVKDEVPHVTTPDGVATDESILDIGPETMNMLLPYIREAKTILWNGPMGNYENGYQKETLACAQAIARSDAYSVVGGGDTVAAIESLHAEDEYSFLSTAGGAMLTFLEEGSLPAIEALLSSKRA